MSGKLAREIQQTKPFSSVEEEAFLNLARSFQLLQERLAGLLKDYQLSPAQYNILRILRGAEPQGLTCSQASERMLSPDPDMTRLLDRLEARHLIGRERSREDRRVVLTRITSEGVELVSRIDGPLNQLLRAMLGPVGENRLRELVETLELMRENAAATKSGEL